jgi:hypothetical protein
MSKDGNPNNVFTPRLQDDNKKWIMATERGSVILVNPIFSRSGRKMTAAGKQMLLEKLHPSLNGWEYRKCEGLVRKSKKRRKKTPANPRRPSKRSKANSAAGQAKTAASMERLKRKRSGHSSHGTTVGADAAAGVTPNRGGSGNVTETKTQEQQCVATSCREGARPAMYSCCHCSNKLHLECSKYGMGEGDPAKLYCSSRCYKSKMPTVRCCVPGCRQKNNTRFIACVSCDGPLHQTCGFPIGYTTRSRDTTRICPACHRK